MQPRDSRPVGWRSDQGEIVRALDEIGSAARAGTWRGVLWSVLVAVDYFLISSPLAFEPDFEVSLCNVPRGGHGAGMRRGHPVATRSPPPCHCCSCSSASPSRRAPGPSVTTPRSGSSACTSWWPRSASSSPATSRTRVLAHGPRARRRHRGRDLALCLLGRAPRRRRAARVVRIHRRRGDQPEHPRLHDDDHRASRPRSSFVPRRPCVSGRLFPLAVATIISGVILAESATGIVAAVGPERHGGGDGEQRATSRRSRPTRARASLLARDRRTHRGRGPSRHRRGLVRSVAPQSPRAGPVAHRPGPDLGGRVGPASSGQVPPRRSATGGAVSGRTRGWSPEPNGAFDAIVVRIGHPVTHGHNSIFDLLPELGLVGIGLFALIYMVRRSSARFLRQRHGTSSPAARGGPSRHPWGDRPWCWRVSRSPSPRCRWASSLRCCW